MLIKMRTTIAIMTTYIFHSLGAQSPKLAPGCREVMVELAEECREKIVDECDDDCEMITSRECQIVMKQVWIPRVVTRCHNNIEQFEDNSCDESGYKSQCMVRYETNCYNKKIYREVTEDYPECKTETVSTCDGNDLFSSRKSRRCQKIQVNKCKISQRTIRKAIPETKCRREPRKFCSNVKCNPRRSNRCIKSIKYDKELRPKEQCKFVEKMMCSEGSNNDRSCVKVSKTVCSPAESNTKLKQLECNGTLIFNNP